MNQQAFQEQDQVAEAGKQGSGDQLAQRPSHFYRPSVDILEHQDAYRVQLDVPGATADGIDIQFAEGVLSVVAKVASRQEPGKKFLLREYGVADYRRSFQIGDQVDAQRIAADYSEGVLTLYLPKVAESQPRKIAVQAG